MEKKVYNFELYTNHERFAGEVLGEYLTKEEMIMMAQGMCRSAAMLKSFVTVRVKEEGVKGYVYATKSK